MSHLESNKPLLAASIGYLRENTEIPQTSPARASAHLSLTYLKYFMASWGAMWRDTEILGCCLCFWFSWVLFVSPLLSLALQNSGFVFLPFTSWVALLYKTLYWSWTWPSLEVFTWPPVALNNDLAFFTQASYFAVRFCIINMNIFSGTMHDPVVWQRVCAKRWKILGHTRPLELKWFSELEQLNQPERLLPPKVKSIL